MPHFFHPTRIHKCTYTYSKNEYTYTWNILLENIYGSNDPEKEWGINWAESNSFKLPFFSPIKSMLSSFWIPKKCSLTYDHLWSQYFVYVFNFFLFRARPEHRMIHFNDQKEDSNLQMLPTVTFPLKTISFFSSCKYSWYVHLTFCILFTA